MEGQAIDMDDIGRGGRIDIAVGREAHRDIDRPAFAPFHPVEIIINPLLHPGWQTGRRSAVEMVAGRRIIARQKIGARKIKPHALEARRTPQDGSKGGDGGLMISTPHRQSAAQEIEIIEVEVIAFDPGQEVAGGIQLSKGDCVSRLFEEIPGRGAIGCIGGA